MIVYILAVAVILFKEDNCCIQKDKIIFMNNIFLYKLIIFIYKIII